MITLGVHAAALGGQLGGWRHPDAFATGAMQLDNTIEIARIAERGKLDFLFLADGNAVRHMDKPALFAANSPSDRPAVFEPVTLFAAISQHTRHIGLVSTATTTYEEPFTIARKFASLDHLSGGRAGWNVVTTSYEEDALNFSRAEHVIRDVRYDRAREAVDVVRGLWDSWGEEAFPVDKATGQYLDPSKVRALHHSGPHFSVRGPLNIARTPQGQPVLFSAGQSEAGRELAAYATEALFSSVTGKAEAQAVYADIKGRMAKYGRSPEALRILPALGVLVGRTDADAKALQSELHTLIAPELGVPFLSQLLGLDLSGYPLDGPVPQDRIEQVGGSAGGRSVQEMAAREGLSIRQAYQRILGSQSGNVIAGDAQTIADMMEDWYRDGACDGFVLQIPVMPAQLAAFVELVVPELQRRGLFRKDYAGSTLRDNLGLRRPQDPFAAAEAAPRSVARVR